MDLNSGSTRFSSVPQLRYKQTITNDKSQHTGGKRLISG